MLLTLCRLPFIWLGPATLVAAPLAVQAVSATTGLVRSITQSTLTACTSILAVSIPSTTAAATAVSASAVFCESPSNISITNFVLAFMFLSIT